MRIFRKIRQKEMFNGKFFKYLLYAIGEVILIFIGVLIAIQFDENREQEQYEAEIELIYTEIQKNILKDITFIEEDIAFCEEKDSIIILVLTEQLTAKDYQDNPGLPPLIASSPSFRQTTTGFDNLMFNKAKLPKKYIALDSLVTYIYAEQAFVLNYEFGMAMDRANEWGLKMKNEKSWYWRWHRDGVQEDQIDYYLNDFTYKNDVTRYRIRVTRFVLPLLKSYKTSSMELYNKIEEVKNKG
jgi:hypothetical protein